MIELCDDFVWLLREFRSDWQFFVKEIREDIRALRRIRQAARTEESTCR